MGDKIKSIDTKQYNNNTKPDNKAMFYSIIRSSNKKKLRENSIKKSKASVVGECTGPI